MTSKAREKLINQLAEYQEKIEELEANYEKLYLAIATLRKQAQHIINRLYVD